MTEAVNCEPSNDTELVLLEGGVPWGNESYEDCGRGCSAVSNATHVGFPAFALVGLIGLAMLIRRRNG